MTLAKSVLGFSSSLIFGSVSSSATFISPQITKAGDKTSPQINISLINFLNIDFFFTFLLTNRLIKNLTLS